MLAAAAAAFLLSLPARGQAPSSPLESPRAPPAVEETPGRIAGFWGVPWGADSAGVVRQLGDPIVVGTARQEGMRVFTYSPALLGHSGFLSLWVHRERGLLRGVFEPYVDDCTDMLRRLVRELKRRYPDVPVRTEGRVPEGGLGGDLCVAAMDETAAVSVVWEDAEGHRLRVGATPGRPALRMTGTAGDGPPPEPPAEPGGP